MNTIDRDEVSNKLNPQMFRQLFSGPSDEMIKFGGKLISEIPEEEDESGSDEDD